MSGLAVAGSLAGGVGLFLLGMGLMTEGLKLAAGPALERILANSTKTRLRGLASGMLVTALVQSSSAVTVAAIGFVNAGLLNLAQALWVLFGANVGTTVIGWLVALVGLKIKIEAFALPLIGLGMILRLTGEGNRRGALGMALAGFGVLFLGIDLLKEAFSGAAADFTVPEWEGLLGVVAMVLIGIVMTVLMQASAAALVLAFSAAQSGLVSLEAAAAVVIGANIGTTVTALIAAIGATPNARRAAAAHIIFNLLTGAVALLLLPWFLGMLGVLGGWLGLDAAPAGRLALFHTAFNLLGVALIWPIADRLTVFLQGRFRSEEEDEARPRHLDKTVLAVPALALNALDREVRHLGGVALRLLRAALAAQDGGPEIQARDRHVVARLNLAIADFITELNRAGMSGDSAQRLPELLRTARYYETAAELAVEAATAAGEPAAGGVEDLGYAAFRRAGEFMLAQADPVDMQAPAATEDTAVRAMENAYQALKASLLEAGARGELPVAAMDARLRAASALHRAMLQVAKAARILAAATRTGDGGGEQGPA